MTSIFITGTILTAILVLAMGVLTQRTLRAERRYQLARGNRYRTDTQQPTAELVALADRRKVSRQGVEIERRRAA